MAATTIAIANQKGGAGKTTTTINLGAALAERGKHVLLVDLDPQGTVSVGFGFNPHKLEKTIYNVLIDSKIIIDDVILKKKRNLDIVPANIDLAGAEVELLNEISREQILKEKLELMYGFYDFILLDCPPSLGLLTINAFTAANAILIPVQCQYFAFRGMQLLLGTIEKVKARSNPDLRVLGLLPTMYTMRTSHAREVLEELKRTYPQLVIDTPIKTRTAVADASVSGKTIMEYDPNSDVAQAYRELAKEVIKRA